MYVGFREEIDVAENQYLYLLEDRVWVTPKGYTDEILTERRRMYSVNFNSATKEATCDCKYFETHGILCRHIISIYDQNFVKQVPECYILRRWRRDVPRKHVRVVVGGLDPADSLLLRRHDNVLKAFDPISDLGPLCQETEKIVVKGLNGVVKKL